MSTVFENVLRAMAWKKSDAASSERLGMSLREYQSVKNEIRQMQKEEDENESFVDLTKEMFTTGYTEDLEKGRAEYKIQTSFEPRTAKEIESLIKLDKTKWKLARYSVWNGGREDVWLTSAKVVAIAQEHSTEQFEQFLKTYQPKAKEFKTHSRSNDRNACLVINKQDAHQNKFDQNGDNDITKRFDNFHNKVENILRKSCATQNLEKIIYVLGSDQFNSEHTGATTHGTPQTNLIDYHTGFEKICEHEIAMIDLLRKYCNTLEILYIPGNHDQYVGWHLVSWLSTYYRTITNIKFDTRQISTKYIKYNNTAMCFNHGYAIKPEALAQNFPIEFREQWSSCNKFYCFVGDKHTEMSKTIGGIKFYRLAQISKAKSLWDDEKGYSLIQGELTTFLIDEKDGLTTIDYQPL